MGQLNNTQTKFVSPIQGKFVSACEQGQHNFERKDHETGRVHYGFATNAFEGYLTNITVEDSQYGRQYHFHWIDDTGEEFKMPMKVGSSIAYGFLNSLAGAAKKGKISYLKLFAKAKQLDDKILTNIYVSDRNGRVEWGYNWKTEVPPTKETKNHRGERVIDDKERYEFFDRVLREEISPALEKIDRAAAKLGLADGQPQTAAPANDDDDIPF